MSRFELVYIEGSHNDFHTINGRSMNLGSNRFGEVAHIEVVQYRDTFTWTVSSSDGTIHEDSIQLGKWMKLNGTGFYGTVIDREDQFNIHAMAHHLRDLIVQNPLAVLPAHDVDEMVLKMGPIAS